MWPFSPRKNKLSDRLDGYTPENTSDADPWSQPNMLAEMRDHAPSTGNTRWDQANLDAYRNELTGLGTWERDKVYGGRPEGVRFIANFVSHIAAEERWRGSDLGGRLIETVPDEMTREGWSVQIQPDVDDNHNDDFSVGSPLEIDDSGIQITEEIYEKFEKLGLLQIMWEALCYERAFGGAAILLGTEDGFKDDLTKPLDIDDVNEITHLTAFSGGWDGELVAWSWYRDLGGPRYGQPEMYMLRNLGIPIAKIPAPGESTQAILPQRGPSQGPLITWVHESRLIVFPGSAVSRRARVQMRGWGDSLFTRVDQILSAYDQTWSSVANLMTDFAQGVLKIKGLAQSLMANNKTGVVSARGRALNLSRSVAGLMMLDSEEDFRREMASLSGLPEVLQQFALRLAAAAEMPVSLLMGQAPAGLSATGDSEIRWFYDRIAAKQRRRMLPQLQYLTRVYLKTKKGPTDGKEPKRWSITTNPLYQLSSTEKADLYLKIAQADQIYMSNSVASAEEVAATRFGGSEFNDGTIVLDLEGRAAMTASEQEPAPQPVQKTAPPKEKNSDVEKTDWEMLKLDALDSIEMQLLDIERELEEYVEQIQEVA